MQKWGYNKWKVLPLSSHPHTSHSRLLSCMHVFIYILFTPHYHNVFPPFCSPTWLPSHLPVFHPFYPFSPSSLPSSSQPALPLQPRLQPLPDVCLLVWSPPPPRAGLPPVMKRHCKSRSGNKLEFRVAARERERQGDGRQTQWRADRQYACL